MDRYRIELYKQAWRDINKIFDYTAHEKMSPETARNQTGRIYEKLSTLETFPQSHQEYTTRTYAVRGYRQLIIDNYVAIFRIDEQKKTAYVVAVPYQGRNI